MAQLVERTLGKGEVLSSILSISTNSKTVSFEAVFLYIYNLFPPVMSERTISLGRSSKLAITFVLLLSVVLCFVYGYYLHSRSLAIGLIKTALPEANVSSEVRWEIENLSVARSRLFVKGWAIIPGGRFSNVRSAFLLRDPDDGTFFELRSYTYERLDIGQRFTPNYSDYLYNFDHDFAGISASADLRDLQKNKRFELYIRFDSGNERELIDTELRVNVEDAR